MEVIPAINTTEFSVVREQLQKASEFAGWVHIDIVDGVFAPNVTWNNPEELKAQIANDQWRGINIEIHLMVENPEQVIEAWLQAGAKRVIVHVEAMTDPTFILETCKKYSADAMLAISPGTPVENIFAYANSFAYLQVLSVPPGKAGQEFGPAAISKIKTLREKFPHVIIEVDGGINPQTAPMAKEAGTALFVAASYIFNNPYPKGAYEQIRKVLT